MSDSDHPTTSIIKSDRTGRTRYTRQYKQEVLAAYEASSLSAPQFAAQCGIKYPTFASSPLANSSMNFSPQQIQTPFGWFEAAAPFLSNGSAAARQRMWM